LGSCSIVASDVVTRLIERSAKNRQVAECGTDAACVFTVGEHRNRLCATAVAGNIHETIALVHYSFALLFFPPFRRRASNLERSDKKSLSNGTVSNRDFLSEVGFALAARILD
jgi:hypothetical protein